MRRGSLAILAVVTLVFGGCNGSNGVSTLSPSVPQVAGEYTGTVTDSTFGTGTGDIILSQAGSSLGGPMNDTFGASVIPNSFALNIDVSGNVSGSSVATINNAACGYKVAGTINSSTGVLSGTYTAFSGCSGQTGTFNLTQQCTNPSTSIRRRDGAHGIGPC